MRPALISLTIAAALALSSAARADWLDIYGHVHHENCMEAVDDPACPAKVPQGPADPSATAQGAPEPAAPQPTAAPQQSRPGFDI